MDNSDAILIGKAKGKAKADIEALLIAKAKGKEKNRYYKDLALRGAKEKYKGDQLTKALQKINHDFNNSQKIIDDQFTKQIKKVASKSKKVKKVSKTGKITKAAKQVFKDVTGGASKTFHKIPYKGPAIITGSVLVAAVALATYRRYKQLEKERVQKLTNVVQKRLAAKARKYTRRS